MLSSTQLLASSDAFFNAFSTNTPPLLLLAHFSSSHPVIIQHAPASCPHPHTSRLTGLNAIRSYFDLLATHWTRSNIRKHSAYANPDTREVVVTASVTWMWKQSGRRWREDFTCTLSYDEHLKIISFVVRTESSPGTCVMRATDADPITLDKATMEVSM